MTSHAEIAEPKRLRRSIAALIARGGAEGASQHMAHCVLSEAAAVAAPYLNACRQ